MGINSYTLKLVSLSLQKLDWHDTTSYQIQHNPIMGAETWPIADAITPSRR
jgi:hypothetical protein